MLPLTSLVPTVVELISFWESDWPHIWWYPFWYLGVPTRFLIGPVVPGVVLLLRWLTGLAIETIYIGVIGMMWVIGGVGVKMLSRELGASKKAQWWSAVFFWVLPMPFILLMIGSGLHHLVVGILPWILIGWWRFFETHKRIWAIGVTGGIGGMLLVDISGLLPAVVGLLAIAVLAKKDQLINRVVAFGVVLFASLAVATIWYSPHMWWVILTNPSFGGKPLANVIGFLMQLLQALIPIILGFFAVSKTKLFHKRVVKFVVLFGGAYGFLTLIRFLSDIDFIADWIGFGLELQLATALFLGWAISRYIKRWYVVLVSILMLTIVGVGLGAHLLYQGDRRHREYREKVIELVNEEEGEGRRWFFSGSGVFWLSRERTSMSKENISQVRGGKDEVSTHQTWAMGAFNIREGTSSAQMQDWLKILGVSRALVHTDQSAEPYHDFKHIERFETDDMGDQGDRVDRRDRVFVGGGYIARSADEAIIDVKRPASGNDRQTAQEYAKALRSPLTFTYIQPQLIDITLSQPLDQSEVISLAITYDSNWRLVQGEGRLVSDAFGNTVIIPATTETSSYRLRYQEPWSSRVVGVVLAVIGILGLMKLEKLALLAHHHAKIGELNRDEEIEY